MKVGKEGKERARTQRGAGRPGRDDASHQLTCWSDVTIQNYKYFKMETGGLDDLFVSDTDSEDELEESLYAKPATTYVSTGEKICPDCKRKVLGTNFIAEMQQCEQCFITLVEASDDETDGFCSSVSSSSSQTSTSGYTDNSAKSSPLNATKLELGKLS